MTRQFRKEINMYELMYGNKTSLHNTARKSYGMQL